MVKFFVSFNSTVLPFLTPLYLFFIIYFSTISVSTSSSFLCVTLCSIVGMYCVYQNDPPAMYQNDPSDIFCTKTNPLPMHQNDIPLKTKIVYQYDSASVEVPGGADGQDLGAQLQKVAAASDGDCGGHPPSGKAYFSHKNHSRQDDKTPLISGNQNNHQASYFFGENQRHDKNANFKLSGNVTCSVLLECSILCCYCYFVSLNLFYWGAAPVV